MTLPSSAGSAEGEGLAMFCLCCYSKQDVLFCPAR